MDGQAVLKNCHFEIYIPPLEGIADANESRTIGFQGETLGVYVLVYNKDRNKGDTNNDDADDDKDSISNTIDSYLSALKFQTQLLLFSTGEDVVLKSQYYHNYQIPNLSVSSSSSPKNGNGNGNNTQKIPSKSSEYASIAKARKSINMNQDMESILQSISQQQEERQESPSMFHHDRNNNNNTNNHPNVAAGYSYSPQRRSRLSFVSEKDAVPFQNPDYIYKILAPIHVSKEHIGVALKLVVKIIVDPFSWTIQHDTIFDSRTLEHNRRQQRAGNNDHSNGRTVNYNKSHREYLSKLVDNSIHCVSDPFCRILSVPFQVLNPLEIIVKSSIIDVVSYINIRTKNTHPKLTLCVNEIQFPLNSTVKTIKASDGTNIYGKNLRLDSNLQTRMPEYDTPIILHPNEEYSFIIQIEPAPYIFTVSDTSSSSNNNNNGDSLNDNTNYDPMFISSGSFQTQATILWGVHQVPSTCIAAGEGSTASSNDGDDDDNNKPLPPKVSLESTIIVPWSRGDNTNNNIHRTNYQKDRRHRNRGNHQKIMMEVEYDPIVRVNNIFTVRIAITNASQDVLSNLNLTIPIESGYYTWENEVPYLSSSASSSSSSISSSLSSSSSSSSINDMIYNRSSLGNKMNKLRNSIIDHGGVSLNDIEDFSINISKRSRLGSSPGNTFEEIDLAGSLNSNSLQNNLNSNESNDSHHKRNLTSEQVLNKTKSLKTTYKSDFDSFSSPLTKTTSDEKLNSLPTPNGRTLFHAIFQYSTFNTSKNRSTITGGANSKQKNGMQGKMSKRRSTTANASHTDPSRNWISDIPLSSQCVLQINADGFKIYATSGNSTIINNSNEKDTKSILNNKMKNAKKVLSKSWQFTSNVRIHVKKLTNEKIRIDIIDDIVTNEDDTISIINSLYFVVRNASIIVKQFEALYSMLIAMLQRTKKDNNDNYLREKLNMEKDHDNNNHINETVITSNPTVICLQANVPLGILAPADTVFSTLHFIALKTGTLKFSGIQIGSNADDIIYQMDRPFAVTVLPKHSMSKISTDDNILSLLPPVSVQDL